MRRVVAAAILLAMGAGGALAAAYDDFAVGLNANNRGDADGAISAFTAALQAGDLAPVYLPVAHLDRARAYLQKGRCADALADLDEAIKLKAGYSEAYFLRAEANACLRKVDASQEDFKIAIGLHPSTELYEHFARVQWIFGLFPQAAESYAEAFALADKRGTLRSYLLLWSAMSADRADTLDATKFAADVSALDSDAWPAPLLDFYRGALTADKLARAAADGTGATDRKCQADFYIGEWHLARKDEAAAWPLLQLAAGECPHERVEYLYARVELERRK